MFGINKILNRTGLLNEDIEPSEEELKAYKITLRLAGMASEVRDGWGQQCQVDKFWKIVSVAIYKQCFELENFI